MNKFIRKIGQFYSLGKHGLYVLALVDVEFHDVFTQYGYAALIKIANAKNAPNSLLGVNMGSRWSDKSVRITSRDDISDFAWAEITAFNSDDYIEYLGEDLNEALAKFNQNH